MVKRVRNHFLAYWHDNNNGNITHSRCRFAGSCGRILNVLGGNCWTPFGASAKPGRGPDQPLHRTTLDKASVGAVRSQVRNENTVKQEMK
jgi:hypothetical protein